MSNIKSDRIVDHIEPPPSSLLTLEKLFPHGTNSPPLWKLLLEHLKLEGRLEKSTCIELIRLASAIFEKESNILEVAEPVTVVGDIHGQFYDLLTVLEIVGCPSENKYLFLGDYLDRGSFSIEVLLLLYSLKLNYPGTFLMLRGNHECRQMTTYFNFKKECTVKYDLDIYEEFIKSFENLPIAAIINRKFLALHGGISPELIHVEQINFVDRKVEPPSQGLLCDLLWSDPYNEDTISTPDFLRRTESNVYPVPSEGSNSPATFGPPPADKHSFLPNQLRGCSWTYGSDVVVQFLKRNKLLGIIRAHEAQLTGYRMQFIDNNTNFPRVITIFSAPNYCDVYNNKGAVLKIANSTLNIQQFTAVPHPYHLPNFMDIFSWSIPFVSEKVLEILNSLLGSDTSKTTNVQLPENIENVLDNKEQKSTLTQHRIDSIRRKIKMIGIFMSMYKTLRMKNELIIKLNDCSPASNLPVELLVEHQEHNGVEKFRSSQSIDSINERRPSL